MHSKDYTSMANSIQKILGKTISELKELEEAETVAGDVADAPKPLFKKKEDELEEANTDKYMWKDINRALMNTGLNPRQIMKVAGLLKGKELKEESGVDEDAETTAADASSKDMPLGKMIRRKDDEDEVNEVKTSIFTLNDMDDEDAATVIAMAKRAGVFLRTKKVSMKRSDVQLKGDKKKIFKFINSLPESIQYKKN